MESSIVIKFSIKGAQVWLSVFVSIWYGPNSLLKVCTICLEVAASVSVSDCVGLVLVLTDDQGCGISIISTRDWWSSINMGLADWYRNRQFLEFVVLVYASDWYRHSQIPEVVVAVLVSDGSWYQRVEVAVPLLVSVLADTLGCSTGNVLESISAAPQACGIVSDWYWHQQTLKVVVSV